MNKEQLLNEIKHLEDIMRVLLEVELIGMAGKGSMNLVLYRRLAALLSASKTLIAQAKQEIQDE